MKTITALMVLTLVATVGISNAYAIEGDGTSHVEVDEYPFNITILEGGSLTLHNNGEQTINFVSHGWFEGSVPPNDAMALEFPVVNCGTTCFTEGMYYISDLNGGYQSTISIVKPEPVYVEPVYVEPVFVEPVFVAPPVQEPIIQELVVEPMGENIEVVTSSATSVTSNVTTSSITSSVTASSVTASSVTASNTTTDIHNVANYEGDVDLITLQTKLVDITSKFNESITTIASLQSDVEIAQMTSPEDLIEKDNIINGLIVANTQLNEDMDIFSDRVDLLEAENIGFTNQIDLLEAEKVNWNLERTSLESERDQWKQLANNWYAVAMEQLEVMVNVLGL
jgi:hypothetical protein